MGLFIIGFIGLAIMAAGAVKLHRSRGGSQVLGAAALGIGGMMFAAVLVVGGLTAATPAVGQTPGSGTGTSVPGTATTVPSTTTTTKPSTTTANNSTTAPVNNPVLGSETDRQVPPVRGGAYAYSWHDLDAQLGKDAKYKECGQNGPAKVNWGTDVPKYKTGEEKSAPKGSVYVMVHGYTETQVPKDKARQAAQADDPQHRDTSKLDVVYVQKGQLTNTAGMEQGGCKPFAETRSFVRLAIGKLVLNNDGTVKGISPGGGVFSGCKNFFSVTVTPPAPKPTPTTPKETKPESTTTTAKPETTTTAPPKTVPPTTAPPSSTTTTKPKDTTTTSSTTTSTSTTSTTVPSSTTTTTKPSTTTTTTTSTTSTTSTTTTTTTKPTTTTSTTKPSTTTSTTATTVKKPKPNPPTTSPAPSTTVPTTTTTVNDGRGTTTTATTTVTTVKTPTTVAPIVTIPVTTLPVSGGISMN